MLNFENINNLPKFCGTYATIIVNYLGFKFATQFILFHCTQEYKMSKLRKFQVKPIKTSTIKISSMLEHLGLQNPLLGRCYERNSLLGSQNCKKL